jgi:hypothetical protein
MREELRFHGVIRRDENGHRLVGVWMTGNAPIVSPERRLRARRAGRILRQAFLLAGGAAATQVVQVLLHVRAQ